MTLCIVSWHWYAQGKTLDVHCAVTLAGVIVTSTSSTSVQWDVWDVWRYLLWVLPQMECFALFVTVSDPHEDDACSHVPPADRPRAACLHLTRQKPDLMRPLNFLQSTPHSTSPVLILYPSIHCWVVCWILPFLSLVLKWQRRTLTKRLVFLLWLIVQLVKECLHLPGSALQHENVLPGLMLIFWNSTHFTYSKCI